MAHYDAIVIGSGFGGFTRSITFATSSAYRFGFSTAPAASVGPGGITAIPGRVDAPEYALLCLHLL